MQDTKTAPQFERITSRKNPRIQRVKKLLSSGSFRRSENAFVIEGVRLVEEAQRSGWAIQEVYIADSLSERGKALFKRNGMAYTARYQVPDEVMADLSDTDTSQGITAVLERQVLPVTDPPDFIIILDAIRDPGNVGTILRTARAVGVKAVFIAPGTADPFSPKVLRAGMGAQMKLPMKECDWDELAGYLNKQTGMKTMLADSSGGKVYWEVNYLPATALIISNEAAGPSPAARKLADQIIQIPMLGDCESLNAAIAASVLMYEIVRQRQSI